MEREGIVLSKSIRLTKEDVIGLNEIIKNDPRIEKGHSEALYYAFKDAAANIPNWTEVSQAKFEGDKDVEISPDDFSIVKTFSIEQDDFYKVLESINKQLGTSRPRFSFITRLCILAARMRLRNKKTIGEKASNKEIVKIKVDCVSLIKKLAELLESTSEDAEEKILKIKEILEV